MTKPSMSIYEARPRRRDSVIVVETAQDVPSQDLLLYDEQQHRAYRLNEAAAAIWNRCDGNTRIQEIIDIRDSNARLLLTRLADDGLLVDVPADLAVAGLTRRALIRRGSAAVAGAAAIPLVEAIVIPTRAAAASAPFGPGDYGSSDPGNSDYVSGDHGGTDEGGSNTGSNRGQEHSGRAARRKGRRH